MLRFEDCFWGTGEDPTLGVRTLHNVFMQHLAEAEDMLALVRARVTMEETYASNLLELGRHSGSGSGGTSEKELRRYSRASTPAIAAGTMTGLSGEKSKLSLNQIAQGLGNAAAMLQSAAASSRLSRPTSWNMVAEPESDTSTIGPIDDQSSIRPVIRTIREQNVAMAATHRRHADTLTLAVISPLQAFVEQHKRAMTKKKNEVDLNHQQLSRLAADIEARRTVYLQKCRIAEEEDRKFREDGETRARRVSTAPIMIGSRSVGPNEFSTIVEQMRKEVKIKSIMTDLGLFEGCFMGDDAIEYLRKRYPGVPRGDLRNVCQEILDRRLITVVVGPNDSDFDRALPYQFGRPLLKTGEPPHVKARKDAEMARLDYDAAIKTAEHTRSALEFHITDYLIAAQDAERYRLKVIKEAVLALESAQVFVVDEVRTTWRPPSVEDTTDPTSPTSLLNSPDPETGVQYIATRYRTGHLRSKPFVFESYKTGRAPHQVFGIGFEELFRATNTAVPPIIRKCVGSLYESFVNGRSAVDTWITPNPDLPSVQFLRMEFNSSPKGGRVSSRTLKRYQPQVVAGVLKLYLVEAPASLCSYDTYETLKMLYSDGFQTFDDDVRIKSVTSLLTTLTPPHFDSLKLFTGYLHELTKDLDDNDDRIIRLAYSLAPCILRPKTETPETLQDQHPWRFTLELMVRYRDFFGPVDKTALMEGALEPSPPPSPEPDMDGDDMARDIVSPRSVAQGLKLKGLGEHATKGMNSPPATPPLREPSTPKGTGSWFPWPLSGNGSTNGSGPSSPLTGAPKTPTGGENSDWDKAKTVSSDQQNRDEVAEKEIKEARRASRLEDRLAGILAKAKARSVAVPVPTSEPASPIPSTSPTPEPTQSDARKSASPSPPPVETTWTSLKSLLGKSKRSSNTSSSSSGRQTPDRPISPATTAPAVAITPSAAAKLYDLERVDTATPPISAISTTELLYQGAPTPVPQDDTPLLVESPKQPENQVQDSQKTYVTSVASAAASFLGSVVGGMGMAGGLNQKQDKEESDVPSAQDGEISRELDDVHAADEEEEEQAEHSAVHTTPTPYDHVLNSDDPATDYDSHSHYEDGGDQTSDDDDEEEEEEEEDAAEGTYDSVEAYDETEVVIVEEDDHSEHHGDVDEDDREEDDYVEMREHMFPASAQDLNEYLQWG
ncbi:hypothetical protein SpCBS45565_g04172 [Spizellomyces sp. 'palustris']|nr:hypothetical protein SpCBS45565_g04172 [Spizellomyces sp. 'palustris']